MTLAMARSQCAPTAAATLPFAWAFAASLAVLAAKSWQALMVPQFWAEDGVVFFIQQHLSSTPLLFETYAGYLNVLPRLVAWIASQFAAAHAPAIYAYAALVIGAAALASLRHAAARIDLPFLILLAVIALMPVNGEVLGRLTNIQWLLQFHLLGVAAACRLGYRSARPAVAVVAVLVSGTTGPFAILTLAGLAAAELVLRSARLVPPSPPGARPWWSAPEFLAMAGAATAQAAVMIAAATRSASPVLGLADLGQLALALQSHLLVAVPLWPEAFAAAIIGVAFAAVLAGTDPGRIRFAALIALVAAAQLVATALKFAGHVYELIPWQNGDRYFLLFRVVVWWLLLLALLAIPRLPRRWALACFGAVLALSAALANGPHLRQQALDNLHWSRYAACIESGQAVRIPIHPRPWTIGVPGTATGPHPCAY